MAKLERDRERLEAKVAEAADRGDHRALADLGAQVAAIGDALAEAEERWLELGALLEG